MFTWSGSMSVESDAGCFSSWVEFASESFISIVRIYYFIPTWDLSIAQILIRILWDLKVMHSDTIYYYWAKYDVMVKLQGCIILWVRFWIIYHLFVFFLCIIKFKNPSLCFLVLIKLIYMCAILLYARYNNNVTRRILTNSL